MKNAILFGAAAIVLAASPASAKMTMSCTTDHMSKMVTMLGGMPDSPHKWEMYKHLAMVNTAMSKGEKPSCGMRMDKSKMSMMKSMM
jgi:hypothetical protein